MKGALVFLVSAFLRKISTIQWVLFLLHHAEDEVSNCLVTMFCKYAPVFKDYNELYTRAKHNIKQVMVRQLCKPELEKNGCHAMMFPSTYHDHGETWS